jgi:predicted Zn finger-like uncharacterized protein
MRLVCLECSAAYEAPDNLFGTQPREVRCNRCGYQWTVIGSGPTDHSAAATLSVGSEHVAQPASAEATAMPPASAPTPAPSPAPAPLPARPPAVVPSLPPSQSPVSTELPPPAIVMEPSAESTRTLLTGAPEDEPIIPQQDPEEKRLSHELDFGVPERHQRPSSEGRGGTRRLALVIIFLIIALGVVAIVFENPITAAFPGLKSIYAGLGL